MKKTLLLFLISALIILSSCGENPNDVSSKEESSYADSVSEEPSFEEVSKEESSETSIEEIVYTPIKPKYCSYDQKPYAVAVGECQDGATVICTDDEGNEYVTESFHGWFSVRFSYKTGTSLTLTQTLDGKEIGESVIYSPRPNTPDGQTGIVAGMNGQFFYEKCLDDFMGKNLPSSGELEKIKSNSSKRLEKIAQNGLDTKIIYIIAPSSITVYPECVPEEYAGYGGKTRRQLMMEAFEESGAIVIDLEDTFEKHKNDEQTIFYKTDSHWTEYGAFLAYTELFNIISEDFPLAKPLEYDGFEWIEGFYKTGDMLNYLRMTSPVYLKPGFSDADCLEYSYFRTEANNVTGVQRRRFEETGVYSEDVTAKFISDTKRSDYPNILLIRDSYGTQLTDLVAGNSNVAYFQKMWDYTFNINTVVNYDIDYVVYVVSEWNAYVLG